MGAVGAQAQGPASLACSRTGERLVRLRGAGVEEQVRRSSSGEEQLAADGMGSPVSQLGVGEEAAGMPGFQARVPRGVTVGERKPLKVVGTPPGDKLCL